LKPIPAFYSLVQSFPTEYFRQEIPLWSVFSPYIETSIIWFVKTPTKEKDTSFGKVYFTRSCISFGRTDR
jgi:hypothetical protein